MRLSRDVRACDMLRREIKTPGNVIGQILKLREITCCHNKDCVNHEKTLGDNQLKSTLNTNSSVGCFVFISEFQTQSV